eukprot:COSAG04_NODE_582_length_12404_cov_81.591792_13_plen_355_part_00
MTAGWGTRRQQQTPWGQHPGWWLCPRASLEQSSSAPPALTSPPLRLHPTSSAALAMPKRKKRLSRGKGGRHKSKEARQLDKGRKAAARAAPAAPEPGGDSSDDGSSSGEPASGSSEQAAPPAAEPMSMSDEDADDVDDWEEELADLEEEEDFIIVSSDSDDEEEEEDDEERSSSEEEEEAASESKTAGKLLLVSSNRGASRQSKGSRGNAGKVKKVVGRKAARKRARKLAEVARGIFGLDEGEQMLPADIRNLERLKLLPVRDSAGRSMDEAIAVEEAMRPSQSKRKKGKRAAAGARAREAEERGEAEPKETRTARGAGGAPDSSPAKATRKKDLDQEHLPTKRYFLPGGGAAP